MNAAKAHVGAIGAGTAGAGLIGYVLPLIPGYSGLPMEVQIGITGLASALLGWLAVYHTPNTAK
jgi:hypothetical protein